ERDGLCSELANQSSGMVDDFGERLRGPQRFEPTSNGLFARCARSQLPRSTSEGWTTRDVHLHLSRLLVEGEQRHRRVNGALGAGGSIGVRRLERKIRQCVLP